MNGEPSRRSLLIPDLRGTVTEGLYPLQIVKVTLGVLGISERMAEWGIGSKWRYKYLRVEASMSAVDPRGGSGGGVRSKDNGCLICLIVTLLDYRLYGMSDNVRNRVGALANPRSARSK